MNINSAEMMKFRTIIILLTLTAAVYTAACTGSKYAAGDGFIVSGEYDKAIEEFKSLTGTNPADDKAFVRLGNAYLKIDQPDKAVNAFTEALRLNPANSEAARLWKELQVKRGTEFLKNGEFTASVNTFEALREKYPEDTGLLTPLADSYFGAGYMYKALDSYKKHLENTPGETSVTESIKKTEEAVAKAGKLLKDAEYYAGKKMYYEASDVASESVEINRENKDAQYLKHFGKGMHHLKRSSVLEKWEAIEAFGYAISIKPEEIEPYYYMAQSYEKKDKNNFDDPIQMYKKVVEIDPEGELGKASRKKIKELTDRKKKMEKFLKKKKKGGDA